jgi:hypothetical protein
MCFSSIKFVVAAAAVEVIFSILAKLEMAKKKHLKMIFVLPFVPFVKVINR